jgi:hypothetical protein
VDDTSGEEWSLIMPVCRDEWQSVAWFALLHEQVHQRLYPYQRHGKRFNQEILRLAEVGAFDEIW